MPHVSIIIPTFNGLSLLQKNLPAVLKTARPGDEILIVDDAGTDGSLAWLSHTYGLVLNKKQSDYSVFSGSQTDKTVTLIQNHTNLRFALSCNRAAELAQGDLLWLLNNDVEPEPDALAYLLPHFSDSKMFAVGCHEKESHLNNISSGKKKLWFAQGLFQHSRAVEFSSGPTDWVSGGSALFDRQKWLKLGGFDPAYSPAYWEDVDISYRARQKGWKLWFEAKSVVHHHHESTNKDVFGQQKIDQMSWKNGQLFTWKNGDVWQKIAFILWQPYWWLKRQAYQKHSL